MGKEKDGSGAGTTAAGVEGFVWTALFVAALATVYVLMQEPEDGPPALWDAPLASYRCAALGSSAVGALVGLWRVLARGAGPGLFGMAVLFNVVLASFWALRFTLVP